MRTLLLAAAMLSCLAVRPASCQNSEPPASLSGFTLTAGDFDDPRTLPNLETLCRVWGYAKYHHPAFCDTLRRVDIDSALSRCCRGSCTPTGRSATGTCSTGSARWEITPPTGSSTNRTWHRSNWYRPSIWRGPGIRPCWGVICRACCRTCVMPSAAKTTISAWGQRRMDLAITTCRCAASLSIRPRRWIAGSTC